ncbi:hypothetical protein BJX66DRAFT_127966 [Aspergillus keveii]|uniref:Uncharacterized protein n=1 Tax=Aspergillus keveii TaxID=714993 RepID=A0ABR4FJJ3_9EURO
MIPKDASSIHNCHCIEFLRRCTTTDTLERRLNLDEFVGVLSTPEFPGQSPPVVSQSYWPGSFRQRSCRLERAYVVSPTISLDNRRRCRVPIARCQLNRQPSPAYQLLELNSRILENAEPNYVHSSTPSRFARADNSLPRPPASEHWPCIR